MNANKNLLHRKYPRIIIAFAKKNNVSYDEALDFFYKSATYKLIREGVSDLHCQDPEYLAQELLDEYNGKYSMKNSSRGNT